MKRHLFLVRAGETRALRLRDRFCAWCERNELWLSWLPFLAATALALYLRASGSPT